MGLARGAMSQQPALPDRPLHVGASVSRVEDDRLLRGGARYVADIVIPNMADVAIVRSPVAHADLGTVDLEPATRMPGVIGAFGASDMTDVRPFPDTNPMVRPVALFPLVRERVRYVGAPVAVVVAEDRYQAEDAAAEVEIDYELLPAVMSVDASLGGSQRLYDEWPDNKVLDFQLSDPEIDAVFEQHRVVRGTYRTHRHTGVPLETRGCIAQVDAGRVTLWSSTQSPHYVRTILGRVLGLAESRIRVIAPDMGGGFGIKSHMYPEEVLVPWLAMKLGRPVRWIEDRTEHFTASNHAREQAVSIEGAFTDEGRILAVRAHIIGDVGSGEIWFPGTGPSIVAAGMITGPYRIDRTLASITCVVTNKTPAGAYRGYGQPEGVFALESLMDQAAAELGLDPVGIRQTNLLRQRMTCPSHHSVDPSSTPAASAKPSTAPWRPLKMPIHPPWKSTAMTMGSVSVWASRRTGRAPRRAVTSTPGCGERTTPPRYVSSRTGALSSASESRQPDRVSRRWLRRWPLTSYAFLSTMSEWKWETRTPAPTAKVVGPVAAP